MRLYKTFRRDGSCLHGNSDAWPRRKDGMPKLRVWTPAEEPEMCHSGWHLAVGERGLLDEWLHATVYLAEGRDEGDCDGNKAVFRQVRLVRRMNWDDKAARLFACDCAARALATQEDLDPRSVEAVRVTRKFARGKASSDELDAAWAAAFGAARGAARDAENKWQEERLWKYLDGQNVRDIPLPKGGLP